MAPADRFGSVCGRAALGLEVLGCVWALGVLISSCSGSAPAAGGRTFATPEDAVKALAAAVKTDKSEEIGAIFGPDAADLVAADDAVAARRRRQVFTVAMAERWRLTEAGAQTRTLVIGNEEWPFPIPLAHDAHGWRFDVAAGREEVLARRIGRNELAAIVICRTYVAAQRLYASRGHDGQPAGLFAKTFRSDPGRQNGLYWKAGPGERRSPLGDLVAYAEQQGRPVGPDGAQPAPFHGYYFKILTAQGAAAAGGAKDYAVGGALSGGFALVAWPAQYDSTGVMTFIVNHEGIVHESDLGSGTDATCRAMDRYNPDPSWSAVQ